MNPKQQLDIINKLVGKISASELKKMQKNVEMYLHPDMSIFIPYLDYCDYAISPQHTHPAYSFIYNFSGPAEVRVYQKFKQSSFGNKPNICAFSPAIPHEEILQDQFKSYIAVIISKTFFEKELKGYLEIDRKTLQGDFFPANEAILSILKRFMTEHNEALPGRHTLLHALALETTHLLIRHCYHYETAIPNVSNKIEINQLINYLNERFSKKITVHKMADYINMSPSHFSRIFKEETGLTPMDFLIQLRVEKAKKYLTHKDHTITEIALNCGFTSSAYFSTCFADRIGLSPKAYRKKQLV